VLHVHHMKPKQKSKKLDCKVILMSLVGTSSDPSDAIHIIDINSFFLLPPQVAPDTLLSTPRQISRVKSSPLLGIELFTFRLTRHTSVLGSSGGRYRIPKGSRDRRRI